MVPNSSEIGISSLLQQPGPKKLKLSKIDLIHKAKKFKVPPLTIYGSLIMEGFQGSLGLSRYYGLGFRRIGVLQGLAFRVWGLDGRWV